MLEIKNLSKTFNPGTVNEKQALTNVSITLNGAGKSTMLNAIAGVWPIDSGSIFVGGVDITRLPEHKRAKYIGRVFQDPMMGTSADMGIDENLAIAARRGKHRTLSWSITRKEREKYKKLLSSLDLG